MDHSQRSRFRITPGARPLDDGATETSPASDAGDPSAPLLRVTGDHTDVQLGRRLRDRDPSALAELYSSHRRRAFGLAYRILDDGAAAEDAVHTAFLALWEQADRLNPHGGRLGSLIMTIVHRRAIDLVRRRSHEVQLVTREHSPDAHNALAGIRDEQAEELFEELLDERPQFSQRLATALAALPAEQRTVIEMAYFEGLTHQAIATRLGLPTGTVKSRMRLGLHRLRGALGVRAGKADRR